jgi:hypothetical protein
MSQPSFEYITDAKGKKTKIVLPVDVYEKMLEDLHDLAVIAERRDEEVMSLDELKLQMQNANVSTRH